MTTKLTLEPSQILLNSQEYWDDRHMHQFPTINRHVREKMTPARYVAGNEMLSKMMWKHHEPLLAAMNPGEFWDIGAGNLEFSRRTVIYARSLGHDVHVADFSRVAIGGVREFFRKTLKDPIAAEDNVHCVDLLTALRILVNWDLVRVINFCRVLDKLTEEERLEVARMIVSSRTTYNHELCVTVGNHDTDDNPQWVEKWVSSADHFNNRDFVKVLTGLVGRELPIHETGPWETFDEVYRLTTVRLGAR